MVFITSGTCDAKIIAGDKQIIAEEKKLDRVCKDALSWLSCIVYCCLYDCASLCLIDDAPLKVLCPIHPSNESTLPRMHHKLPMLITYFVLWY